MMLMPMVSPYFPMPAGVILHGAWVKGHNSTAAGSPRGFTITDFPAVASGNDRCIVTIVCGDHNSGARTLGLARFNGVDGVVYGTQYAARSTTGYLAAAHWLDGQIPTSAGSYGVQYYSSNILDVGAIVLYLSGIDQTTPLENFVSEIYTSLSVDSVCPVSVLDAAGKTLLSTIFLFNGPDFTPGNIPPSNLTYVGDADMPRTSQIGTATYVAGGYTLSVADDNEQYDWTLDCGSAPSIARTAAICVNPA